MKRIKLFVKPAIAASAAITFVLLLATVDTSANIANLNRPVIIDSIVVQKIITSSKYKVRLYPNANHQVLFFSASGRQGKVYQLFVFDMEGKLVKRANIRNKETSVVNNLDKGVYLFEVFSDDERIENGQLFIH
ncbi:MAG TPA: T9SS type A sorting domain-containing protein [Flavitalea sp.]|nr:T9SS type A sorting domain-containing protein [Flavitalea sp.]